jgi:hypothetical protein
MSNLPDDSITQQKKRTRLRMVLVILVVLVSSFFDYFDSVEPGECGIPAISAAYSRFIYKLDNATASDRTARWLHPLIAKVGYHRLRLRMVKIVAVDSELFDNSKKLSLFKDNCQVWAFMTKLFQLLNRERAAAIALAETLPPCSDGAIRQKFMLASKDRVFLGRAVNACKLSDSLVGTTSDESALLTLEPDHHRIPLAYVVAGQSGAEKTQMKSLSLAVADFYEHGESNGKPASIFQDGIPPYTEFVDPESIQPISGFDLVCRKMDWEHCQGVLAQPSRTKVKLRVKPRRGAPAHKYSLKKRISPTRTRRHAGARNRVAHQPQKGTGTTVMRKSLKSASRASQKRPSIHKSLSSQERPLETNPMISGHIIVVGIGASRSGRGTIPDPDDQATLQATYLESLLDRQYLKPVRLWLQLLIFAIWVWLLATVFWKLDRRLIQATFDPTKRALHALFWSGIVLLLMGIFNYFMDIQFGYIILTIWNFLATLLGLIAHLFLEYFLKEKPAIPDIGRYYGW